VKNVSDIISYQNNYLISSWLKNVLTDESAETESWPYNYSTKGAVNNAPS